MLESLLHHILPCMKHSMSILRLSHLLDNRTSLSFQSKVLSVQHSSVTYVMSLLCLVKSTALCTPTVNVNIGVVHQLTLQLLRQLASASRQTATAPAL